MTRRDPSSLHHWKWINWYWRGFTPFHLENLLTNGKKSLISHSVWMLSLLIWWQWFLVAVYCEIYINWFRTQLLILNIDCSNPFYLNIDESKASYPILVQTNRTCEWVRTFAFKYWISYPFYINIAIELNICSIVCLGLQSTPNGYVFEILTDFYFVGVYFLANMAIVVLFISISLHHQAFYKMF